MSEVITNIGGEKYYTCKQASEEFGLSYAAIYSACKDGRINARQTGRSYMVSESDIREYIENRKKRIVVDTSLSEWSVEDIANEILKRIEDAYERGVKDGKKAMRDEFTQAFKSVGK
jgi:excisionase family DNA binding protein